MLAKIKTLAMDKTGTLTEGDFRLTDLKVLAEDRSTVLGLLASVEQRSSHPIERALCRKEKNGARRRRAHDCEGRLKAAAR